MVRAMAVAVALAALTLPVQAKDLAQSLRGRWTADKKAITVSIVNPSNKPHAVKLNLGNTAIKDSVTQWEITGTNPEVHNEPGANPQTIKPVEKKVPYANALPAPAYSAQLYRLELK